MLTNGLADVTAQIRAEVTLTHSISPLSFALSYRGIILTLTFAFRVVSEVLSDRLSSFSPVQI
jgi:hypothetical protein